MISMWSHLSLGVRDLDRAQSFYDAALAPLGYVRLWRAETALGYGPPDHEDQLALKLRDDDRLAAGPGFHLCLRARDEAAVDAFHRAACEAGGLDEGAPGLRPRYGPKYYAAFVIDLDGHKLEALVHRDRT